MMPHSSRSTALVVEDLPHVRRGLCAILTQAFPGITVMEASDLKSAREQLARSDGYRIALIDLGLPDGSGLELIRDIRGAHPSTLAVVTTIYDDDQHVFSAIAAGADGYLLKEHTPDVLVQHLKRLDEGLPALSPAVARRILGYFRRNEGFQGPFGASPVTGVRQIPADERGDDAQLTGRETEVLALIGRGMQRGEVAELLTITENTVAKYVKEIYRKLCISSRAEAALEARRRGLV